MVFKNEEAFNGDAFFTRNVLEIEIIKGIILRFL
jgi:hypothetical protein